MIIPPNVNAHSYLCGRGDAEREHRIRTRAAIREAVMHARGLDASAREMGDTMASEVRRERARSIRYIIRQALKAAAS